VYIEEKEIDGVETIISGIYSDNTIFNSNKYNTAIIPHSWKSNPLDDSPSDLFNIIFCSRYPELSFNNILIEIERISDDNDIYVDDAVRGRYLDDDDVEAKVYKIKRLLPQNEDNVVIKKIGVWGRSELPLIINGEEIKIGPSGCFELDNYDIRFFGVCAQSPEDKFIVDYQYEKEQKR
jgi:hypothetical protein